MASLEPFKEGRGAGHVAVLIRGPGQVGVRRGWSGHHGDIHGYASKLEDRLQGLGYMIDPDTGAYRHPERTVVFVGDLIDRGPEQLRDLQIVMGIHEFSAIAYATRHTNRPGEYLRPTTPRTTDSMRHSWKC